VGTDKVAKAHKCCRTIEEEEEDFSCLRHISLLVTRTDLGLQKFFFSKYLPT
jgi:hypothetical protein